MTEIETVQRSTVVTDINGGEDDTKNNVHTADHHNGHHNNDQKIVTSTESMLTATTVAATKNDTNNNNSKTATLSPRAGTANSDTVLVHAWPRSPLIPHLSPFVLKLETWLRMNGIPYELTDQQPQHSKTSKMPWIEYRGQQMYDSQLIIEQLSQRGVGRNMDISLGARESAVSRAFQKMIDEYTIWSLTVWRFIRDPECRALSPAAMPTLSGMKGYLVKPFMKRRAESYAMAQGIGRLDDSVFQEIIKKDLKALSDYMGTNNYLMGDAPHSVDASLFGLTAQYVWFDTTSPFHAYIKESTPNLVEHAERMRAEYFADWDDLLAKTAPQSGAAKPTKTAETASTGATITSTVAGTTLTKKEKTPKKSKKAPPVHVDTGVGAAVGIAVVGALVDHAASTHYGVHNTENEPIINTASPGYVAADHQYNTTTTTTTVRECLKTNAEVPIAAVSHHDAGGVVNHCMVAHHNGSAYASVGGGGDAGGASAGGTD